MRSWGAENSVLQEGALGKATLGARDSRMQVEVRAEVIGKEARGCFVSVSS